MSCPGLHCPGCSEGQSLGILALAVVGLWLLDQTVQVVAEHIWEIGATVAACFALAVAAGMWLEARTERLAAGFAERRGIASRADVDELTPAGVAYLLRREQDRAVLAATVIPQVTEGTAPPAIVNNYHIHFGPADREAARIIRQALPGGPE